MTVAVVFVLGGILVLAWNVWQRRGASRAARDWASDGDLRGFTARSVLLVRPAAAVAAIAGGVALLGQELWPMQSGLVVVPGLLMLACLLLLLAYLILPLPVPRLLVPGWYRRRPGRGAGE